MGFVVFLILIPLAWLGTLIASVAVSVNAFQRWGRVRGAWGILCPLGVLLTLNIGSVFVPIPPMTGEDRIDRIVSILKSVAYFILGIALAITGWVKTHPHEFPEGCCQKCGYELNDLPRCPECGTDHPPTNGGELDQTSKATTSSPGPTPLDSLAGEGDQRL
ncbi:MAG: hypothetical protein IT434_13560 [Phycisphaerales bacterium]|jgi:hypothetical protein|nr:hypothetical protein [Phycisphaerales bacterium]